MQSTRIYVGHPGHTAVAQEGVARHPQSGHLGAQLGPGGEGDLIILLKTGEKQRIFNYFETSFSGKLT